MDMPAVEFWEGDPWLAEGYREAHALKRQRKSQEMWLQGLYIHDAVGVVVGNAFKKKGAAPYKYLEQPIRLLPLTEEERAAKAEEERQKTIAYFNRLAKQWENRAP